MLGWVSRVRVCYVFPSCYSGYACSVRYPRQVVVVDAWGQVRPLPVAAGRHTAQRCAIGYGAYHCGVCAVRALPRALRRGGCLLCISRRRPPWVRKRVLAPNKSGPSRARREVGRNIGTIGLPGPHIEGLARWVARHVVIAKHRGWFLRQAHRR